jgi:hypothetical protein
MKLSVRREICDRLPRSCPYFQWRLRQLGLPPKDIRDGDKLALGLSDPGFVANLAQSYFEAEQPLPGWLLRYLPYRAYLYLMGQRVDRSLVMAYALAQNQTQSVHLKTLLLARGLTLEQIATRCNLSVEVVRVFHDLFWAVHERLDEELFIVELLEREGSRQMEWAYAGGADAVQVLAETKDQRASALRAELREEILWRALKGIKRGRYSPDDNPLLVRAGPLLAEAKKQSEDEDQREWKRTFGHPSVSQAFQEGFMRMKTREMHERLAIQRGEEEKSQRTKAAEEGPETSPPPSPR